MFEKLRSFGIGRNHRPRSDGEIPANLSSGQPGLLLILLDQSRSMENYWGDTDELRMDVATRFVNDMIDRILCDSQQGSTNERKIWISVLGYSGLKNDGRNEHFVRQLGEGWPEDFTSEVSDWIAPRAEGNTWMNLAFQGARQYLEQFYEDPDRYELFSQSPPPVVLNITDGRATELMPRMGDPKALQKSVRDLWHLRVPSGHAPLVFNVHIAEDSAHSVVLPTAERTHELDDYGRELLKLSSEVPHSWIRDSHEDFKPPIMPGAFGLIMNSKPQDLMNFLSFASRAGDR